jgi:CDP-paratose 2-epimerase
MVELLTGKKMKYQYRDQPRVGDHICYISNLARFQSHYPEWTITRFLNDIVREIISAWQERLKS